MSHPKELPDWVKQMSLMAQPKHHLPGWVNRLNQSVRLFTTESLHAMLGQPKLMHRIGLLLHNRPDFKRELAAFLAQHEFNYLVTTSPPNEMFEIVDGPDGAHVLPLGPGTVCAVIPSKEGSEADERP